jgi:N-formylglutamate deformylase
MSNPTSSVSSPFTFIQGSLPLLISMPHNGQKIPDYIAETMQPSALDVPDTDWYIDKLYDFAQALGASILMPTYSRYVIDLNRDPQGENLYPGANSTELCPTSSFALTPLYLNKQQPDQSEITRRIQTYWQPYHQKLADTLQQMKAKHGVAVLLDAHSILSEVPRFFTGKLPDFNFGTADGKTCANTLIDSVTKIDFSPYSTIVNGRFKGGFITRHYGNPEENIHALQLELSQRTYMHEPTNQYYESEAARVKVKLTALVQQLIAFAHSASTTN